MKRNYYIITLIYVIFFAISFLTNVLGALNPNVTDSFHLSGTMTGMLPFSFFIAYALMSIPSGIIVQKFGEKTALLTAWILAFAGSLALVAFPSFQMFLLSLFLIGSGMAILQVALFPLLRVSGGEEHFAFNSVIVQLVFGAGSFLSPFVYSALVLKLADDPAARGAILNFVSELVPGKLPWVSIYLVFALISLVLILLITSSKFPAVIRTEDELTGTWDTFAVLLKDRTVIGFTIGIFLYVGAEQGISNWISEFLRTYYSMDPVTSGAATVGLFWGMMTVGCFLGLLLLKFIDSKIVLRIFTVGAVIAFAFAIYGGKQSAVICFPLTGFFMSVMYAIIFSLALNSVHRYHGSFSGILCTAIAGGAVFALLIGNIKDLAGLRAGLTMIFLLFAYIISISFWADPLVKNATIRK
jgi:MFS transporter, FHS family, L-fucose permease